MEDASQEVKEQGADDGSLRWATIACANGNVMRFEADPIVLEDAIGRFEEGAAFHCATLMGSIMVFPHHAVAFIAVNTTEQIKAEQANVEEAQRRARLAPSGGVRQR